MKKAERILLGATIAVGVVDLFLAHSVYLKKKGVVLRDMVLQSLDRKTHKAIDEEAEEVKIPIE